MEDDCLIHSRALLEGRVQIRGLTEKCQRSVTEKYAACECAWLISMNQAHDMEQNHLLDSTEQVADYSSRASLFVNFLVKPQDISEIEFSAG